MFIAAELESLWEVWFKPYPEEALSFVRKLVEAFGIFEGGWKRGDVINCLGKPSNESSRKAL